MPSLKFRINNKYFSLIIQKKQFFDKTNELINFTYEYHAYAENHLLKTITISKHDIDGLCPNTYIND